MSYLTRWWSTPGFGALLVRMLALRNLDWTFGWRKCHLPRLVDSIGATVASGRPFGCVCPGKLSSLTRVVAYRSCTVGVPGRHVALTRKGARRITVDDVVYRWTVRRKPTYAQALGWSPLTCAVEQEDHPGSTLVVSLPWAHPGNFLALPPGCVRPGTVARAIRVALARGWQPASPGSPFKLDLPTDQ